jgi:DNA-binding PadR family transcriptional regulator
MSPDQKEELRRLVLGYLARRAACAYNCVSVHQGIRRDMPCTEEEAEETLHFLKSSGLLDEVENKLGSRRYYQANAKGILAWERGE